MGPVGDILELNGDFLKSLGNMLFNHPIFFGLSSI